MEIFLAEFLDKTATHFSGGSMTPTKLLLRLQHFWNTEDLEDAEEKELEELAAAGYPIRTSWIPAQLTIFSTRVELVWNLASAAPVLPQVPPGFLEEPESGVEILQPIPSPISRDLEVSALIESEPPESARSGAPRTLDAELRGQERQKIRQARLRAALAQLRAERLADRYYRRYGTYELEGSESDLSDEEEAVADRL